MKNLIKSTIILTTFSLSIIMFQLSCQEEIEAQTTDLPSNRFLYFYGENDGVTDLGEFWTAKLDGTDKKKIPISLPAGIEVSESAQLTPDGQTLIFCARDKDETTDTNYIYSISIDGTNLVKLAEAPGKTDFEIYFSVLQTY